jgi:hypothetical protein
VKIDELKKAKDQRPFQPFHVCMADGREIQVTHPDAVAWHPDTPRIAVFIVPGGGWEIVDVALITSLGGQARVEPIEENGQNPNGGE